MPAPPRSVELSVNIQHRTPKPFWIQKCLQRHGITGLTFSEMERLSRDEEFLSKIRSWLQKGIQEAVDRDWLWPVQVQVAADPMFPDCGERSAVRFHDPDTKALFFYAILDYGPILLKMKRGARNHYWFPERLGIAVMD